MAVSTFATHNVTEQEAEPSPGACPNLGSGLIQNPFNKWKEATVNVDFPA